MKNIWIWNLFAKLSWKNHRIHKVDYLSTQKYESASQVGVRELKTFAINKPVLLIYTSCAFMNRSSTALLS